MKVKLSDFFKIIKGFAVIGVAGVSVGFVAVEFVSDPRKEIRVNVKAGPQVIYAKAASHYLDTGKFRACVEELLSNIRHLPNWNGPYITAQQSMDPWGRRYIFRTPGLHGEIDVVSLGADGLVGGTDLNSDIGNWQ